MKFRKKRPVTYLGSNYFELKLTRTYGSTNQHSL